MNEWLLQQEQFSGCLPGGESWSSVTFCPIAGTRNNGVSLFIYSGEVVRDRWDNSAEVKQLWKEHLWGNVIVIFFFSLVFVKKNKAGSFSQLTQGFHNRTDSVVSTDRWTPQHHHSPTSLKFNRKLVDVWKNWSIIYDWFRVSSVYFIAVLSADFV